ncbi:hypothetical protein [Sphingobacterium sp. SYP-B4668]|uniref:hypothetical protein n=1 Tax=Sphingobacterium sp. SYP-B4668 TaxID=2996035 RepID=UPI0022DE76BD|nr:hypothetical protein [Sphingobacterium sp. SYP-B4668]
MVVTTNIFNKASLILFLVVVFNSLSCVQKVQSRQVVGEWHSIQGMDAKLKVVVTRSGQATLFQVEDGATTYSLPALYYDPQKDEFKVDTLPSLAEGDLNIKVIKFASDTMLIDVRGQVNKLLQP